MLWRFIPQMPVLPLFEVIHSHELGNRLTRRPCKGDEFEILIFEAKRQNAGFLQESSKNVCNMDIHVDWQACDSRVKICVSRAR